jgi:hypothetical protein
VILESNLDWRESSTRCDDDDDDDNDDDDNNDDDDDDNRGGPPGAVADCVGTWGYTKEYLNGSNQNPGISHLETTTSTAVAEWLAEAPRGWKVVCNRVLPRLQIGTRCRSVACATLGLEARGGVGKGDDEGRKLPQLSHSP